MAYNFKVEMLVSTVEDYTRESLRDLVGNALADQEQEIESVMIEKVEALD